MQSQPRIPSFHRLSTCFQYPAGGCLIRDDSGVKETRTAKKLQPILCWFFKTNAYLRVLIDCRLKQNFQGGLQIESDYERSCTGIVPALHTCADPVLKQMVLQACLHQPVALGRRRTLRRACGRRNRVSQWKATGQRRPTAVVPNPNSRLALHSQSH